MPHDDDTKEAARRARESLSRGFGELLKVAGSAAAAVRREASKVAPTVEAGAQGVAGLGKAVGDAGREVVRAATTVATVVGDNLAEWGRKTNEAIDVRTAGAAGEGVGSARGPAESPVADGEGWPKSREEYERKYGRDGEDWPKSREEYERKYGRPPTPRSDDDDPGFRIA